MALVPPTTDGPVAPSGPIFVGQLSVSEKLDTNLVYRKMEELWQSDRATAFTAKATEPVPGIGGSKKMTVLELPYGVPVEDSFEYAFDSKLLARSKQAADLSPTFHRPIGVILHKKSVHVLFPRIKYTLEDIIRLVKLACAASKIPDDEAAEQNRQTATYLAPILLDSYTKISSNGFAHGSISPQTVAMDLERGKVNVFGFYRNYDLAAPSYNSRSDLLDIGMCLYAMVTGKRMTWDASTDAKQIIMQEIGSPLLGEVLQLCLDHDAWGRDTKSQETSDLSQKLLKSVGCSDVIMCASTVTKRIADFLQAKLWQLPDSPFGGKSLSLKGSIAAIRGLGINFEGPATSWMNLGASFVSLMDSVPIVDNGHDFFASTHFASCRREVCKMALASGFNFSELAVCVKEASQVWPRVREILVNKNSPQLATHIDTIVYAEYANDDGFLSAQLFVFTVVCLGCASKLPKRDGYSKNAVYCADWWRRNGASLKATPRPHRYSKDPAAAMEAIVRSVWDPPR